MPKKQNTQDLISEADESVNDVKKAIDAAPRAVSPRCHPLDTVTEEDPKTKESEDAMETPEAEKAEKETPEHEAGESAEFEAGEREEAGEKEAKNDHECICTHDGECECGAKESEESEEGSEEGEGEESEVDMEEDVQALIGDEANLTEGFKVKAKTIFEAAVKSKLRAARKELHESYQRKLGQKAEEILNTVTEQVDSYLTYVIESWMKENQVAVDSTLRTEIAEGFITSLKNVFAENYIEVPKADKDLVESLNSRVIELQEQVKQASLLAESSKKQNEKLQRKAILAEASKGLAVTQSSRLTELTKDVTFESVESFAKKVATIKESYFSGKAPQSAKPAPKAEPLVKLQKAVSSGTTQIIVEGQEDPMVNLSSDMKQYLSAISRAERGNPNRK